MNDMTIISVGEFKKERNWGKGQKNPGENCQEGHKHSRCVLVLEQQFFLRKACKRITGMKY